MLLDGGGRTLGRVDGTTHLAERALAKRTVVEKHFYAVSMQPWPVRCKCQRCDMRAELTRVKERTEIVKI